MCDRVVCVCGVVLEMCVCVVELCVTMLCAEKCKHVVYDGAVFTKCCYKAMLRVSDMCLAVVWQHGVACVTGLCGATFCARVVSVRQC